MQVYKPISCEMYDQLESFATMGLQLLIIYNDSTGLEQQLTGRISAMFTKDKAEYLVIDEQITIRLDMLISINGMLMHGYC